MTPPNCLRAKDQKQPSLKSLLSDVCDLVESLRPNRRKDSSYIINNIQILVYYFGTLKL